MVVTIGTRVFDEDGKSYFLDETINSGGFGTVYKAHREPDGKTVAVKTLPTDFVDLRSILSFQKELQQSLVIKSKHVIKYYYVNDGNMQPSYPPYIVMEYADGGTLFDLLTKQRQKDEMFSNDEIYSICRQLAYGMKDINACLTHRDIKPQNVLLKGGVLKITDFGLSKLVDDSTKSQTFKGGGTAPYMAPEVWNYDKNTMQIDIYAMGIVFYEVATLQYPYDIPALRSSLDYREAHLNKAPNNPTKINPNLPSEFVSVIIKMLSKSTRDRYANWDEILNVFSTKAGQQTGIGSLVSMALEKQNTTDLAKQAKEAERKSQIGAVNEYIKLIESQFENGIIANLKEFVHEFNEKYPGKNKFLITRMGVDRNTPYFSHELDIGEQCIRFKCEVLLKENHKQTISDVFGGRREVECISQVDNKPILLWCAVSDNGRKGFNLLLLKEDDSDYGGWYLLENTNSGLSGDRFRRPEPFGFEINELPKEIQFIHAMHVYNSKLSVLPDNYVIEFAMAHI